MTLARDEHEASRGEVSESHVRLASWTQSWNRLAESIPWNRLASPRHESKHLGLASTRSRRGKLALELASLEPTRRLISPTVCYVKSRFGGTRSCLPRNGYIRQLGETSWGPPGWKL